MSEDPGNNAGAPYRVPSTVTQRKPPIPIKQQQYRQRAPPVDPLPARRRTAKRNAATNFVSDGRRCVEEPISQTSAKLFRRLLPWIASHLHLLSWSIADFMNAAPLILRTAD